MAEEKVTASSKLTKTIEKNKKCIIAIFAVIVVALIAYIVIDTCSDKAAKKGLAAIDEISYALTNESSKLDEAELTARENEALENLAAYTKKGGIVGVRANMLAADITYKMENYEDSLNYWKATADKGKKAYTTPIAYFNMGACYEALNNNDSAAESYKKAADTSDYVLQAHAKFSYGRVLEAKGDFAGAVAAYTELNDLFPEDTWAKIAKTRIIKLQIEGKAE